MQRCLTPTISLVDIDLLWVTSPDIESFSETIQGFRFGGGMEDVGIEIGQQERIRAVVDKDLHLICTACRTGPMQGRPAVFLVFLINEVVNDFVCFGLVRC